MHTGGWDEIALCRGIRGFGYPFNYIGIGEAFELCMLHHSARQIASRTESTLNLKIQEELSPRLKMEI
jgi:hypothetical protein